MVDPKRLIESMELCMGAERDCHKCMYCEMENDCRDSMIYDAVELLKEHGPVKPSVDVDTYVCPNCGHRLEVHGMLGDIVVFDERYNFCPACGQAVKWDD